MSAESRTIVLFHPRHRVLGSLVSLVRAVQEAIEVKAFNDIDGLCQQGCGGADAAIISVDGLQAAENAESLEALAEVIGWERVIVFSNDYGFENRKEALKDKIVHTCQKPSELMSALERLLERK